ncbi:MAG: 3-deoxy-7-phosphoheptulonate synthase [Verrucomicrobia bacterium]|nr:3-deoxy-7-phosphoheptulonate synthase [Verrucomicrobiota bacterium]
MSLPLPSPREIRSQLPLSEAGSAHLSARRSAARQIVSGKDSRKVFIIGPCSIHDRAATLEYAERFHQLAREVDSTCLLVMRTYMEKPRTSIGWKGFLYDPHLDGSNDILTGILWTRELLLLLAEKGIPTAAEFVDPLAALYFEDLITWGFIGARTSSSQPHRQFASSLDIPVGIKNSIDGNLECAVQGVRSVKAPHTLLQSDLDGRLATLETDGNPYAHIVLRGACFSTNYDAQSIDTALMRLQNAHLSRRLLVDCSHGNSGKHYPKQSEVFHSVLKQIEQGNEAILGLMLESHLEEGSQPLIEDPSQLKYAVSITDACINWPTTEGLIYSAHQVLSETLASL